ncbi:hypothetical protein D3C86_1590120 [compost metagenome]
MQITLKEQLNSKGEIEGLIKQIEDRDALIQRERERSRMQSEENIRNLEFMEQTYGSEMETLKTNLTLLQNENLKLANLISEANQEAADLRYKLLEKETVAIKPLSTEEVRRRMKMVKLTREKDHPDSEIPDEG